jgi:hypothetical protein
MAAPIAVARPAILVPQTENDYISGRKLDRSAELIAT